MLTLTLHFCHSLSHFTLRIEQGRPHTRRERVRVPVPVRVRLDVGGSIHLGRVNSEEKCWSGARGLAASGRSSGCCAAAPSPSCASSSPSSSSAALAAVTPNISPRLNYPIWLTNCHNPRFHLIAEINPPSQQNCGSNREIS